jgi:hypothetical protein
VTNLFPVIPAVTIIFPVIPAHAGIQKLLNGFERTGPDCGPRIKSAVTAWFWFFSWGLGLSSDR